MKQWWKWTLAKLTDQRGFWGSTPSGSQATGGTGPAAGGTSTGTGGGGGWGSTASPATARIPWQVPQQNRNQPMAAGAGAGNQRVTRGTSAVGPTWGTQGTDYWRQIQQLRQLGFLR